MTERRDIYDERPHALGSNVGDSWARSGSRNGASPNGMWAFDDAEADFAFAQSDEAGKAAAARAVQAADMRAFSRAGSGRASGSGGFSRTADRALMLALFAVVVLALLGLLTLGTNAYRTLAEDRNDAAALRQESGLLLNTVRANDAIDAVQVGEGPEGPALVLVERLDSGTYETRLYAYQGFIMQEYVVAGAEYDPASATRMAKSQRFEFAYDAESGLLTMVTDAGEARIALRCGGGEEAGDE